TAEEIVKKALDARGGVEKIKGVQTERVTGQVSFSREMEGTFIVELKRPLKMRTEITVEGQKIIRVYDGKSTGWMINPFLENKEAQPLSSEDLKNISDESDFHDVQGLKYPFRIDQGSPGTEIKQTLTAEKIEINPPIDDSHFAKPQVPTPAADPPHASPTPPPPASNSQ